MIDSITVSVERRYLKYNNKFYVKGIENQAFFERYLSVFKCVYIIARVTKVYEKPIGYEEFNSEKIIFRPINTKGTGILKLPDIIRVLKKTDYLILRTPGVLAYIISMVSVVLRKKFSIEVVTNPAQESKNLTKNKILNNIFHFIFDLIFKLQLRKCDFASFVTKSEIQEAYLSSDLLISDKYSSSYSSIDINKDFYYYEEKKYSDNSNVKLLFVGVLDRDFKGLDIFLKILSLLPHKYIATVVGDGVLLEFYKKFSIELGIKDRVQFLGYVTDEKQKLNIYRKHDIFLLTSRREGLPRVVIEAMANGLPCICTDVSGVRELIEDKYICNIDDYKAFSDKILSLSIDEIITMSKNNYENSIAYCNSNLTYSRNIFYKKILNIRE
ncbi:TPA: glycosyltransferase [Photobacterium damselae]